MRYATNKQKNVKTHARSLRFLNSTHKSKKFLGFLQLYVQFCTQIQQCQDKFLIVINMHGFLLVDHSQPNDDAPNPPRNKKQAIHNFESSLEVHVKTNPIGRMVKSWLQLEPRDMNTLVQALNKWMVGTNSRPQLANRITFQQLSWMWVVYSTSRITQHSKIINCMVK